MNVRAAEHLVGRLNRAWPQEDFAQVADCYHPDALLWPPDGGTPIVGRSAIVATYREFATAARLARFDQLTTATFPIGASVAVHMRFEVAYTLGADHFIEGGLEIYWIDATPLIIWRHQLVESTRTQPAP